MSYLNERYEDRSTETDECSDCGREVEWGEKLCSRCLADYDEDHPYE